MMKKNRKEGEHRLDTQTNQRLSSSWKSSDLRTPPVCRIGYPRK